MIEGSLVKNYHQADTLNVITKKDILSGKFEPSRGPDDSGGQTRAAKTESFIDVRTKSIYLSTVEKRKEKRRECFKLYYLGLVPRASNNPMRNVC